MLRLQPGEGPHAAGNGDEREVIQWLTGDIAPLAPIAQVERERELEAVRSTLGDVAFAAAYDAGRALPPEGAVAAALALAGELAAGAEAAAR